MVALNKVHDVLDKTKLSAEEAAGLLSGFNRQNSELSYLMMLNYSSYSCSSSRQTSSEEHIKCKIQKEERFKDNVLVRQLRRICLFL